MSFKTLFTDDLIRIAAVGGGFRLNASGRTTEDLIPAINVDSCVFFSCMSKRITDDLIRVGAAGKGCVVFEE